MLVLSLIENKIESPTDWNNSIAPITKLLLTLRFYSLGEYLPTVLIMPFYHVSYYFVLFLILTRHTSCPTFG